ncbi:phosphatidate cytidylyltransferase [Stappia sp. MMSF_3263]|uniref:phosphatidate cytidylyltransferase n=1 Tax=Stappia sp. MMSF_3263 TaxID=3046693 RepID=UPI00273D827B|nr:phosphatidate cytidylyltransferase [Stappia sp. MMSF_3263]
MSTQTLSFELAAVAVLACLVIGAVLLGVGSLLPATAPRARPLWPVFATECAIVAGALLPFALGSPWLDALLGLLAVRIAYEALCVAGLRWPGATATQRMRLAVEVAVFPGFPVLLFVMVAREPENSGLVLVSFLLVETYDSYALLGGKLFGRRPAFPRLSPRKTVEGLVAGAVMLGLTAALAGPLVVDWSIGASLSAAILIAVTAIAGDLAGSRLKRASSVKDYPQVLPRQGGLLDITDAWLIAAPALVWLAGLW